MLAKPRNQTVHSLRIEPDTNVPVSLAGEYRDLEKWNSAFFAADQLSAWRAEFVVSIARLR